MRAGERNGDDSSVTGEIDLARIAPGHIRQAMVGDRADPGDVRGFRDIRECRQAAL